MNQNHTLNNAHYSSSVAIGSPATSRKAREMAISLDDEKEIGTSSCHWNDDTHMKKNDLANSYGHYYCFSIDDEDGFFPPMQNDNPIISDDWIRFEADPNRVVTPDRSTMDVTQPTNGWQPRVIEQNTPNENTFNPCVRFGMQRGLQPYSQSSTRAISLPASHIHRTESEQQLQVDTAAAEWRDLCMFNRLVGGIRERQISRRRKKSFYSSSPGGEECERLIEGSIANIVRNHQENISSLHFMAERGETGLFDYNSSSNKIPYYDDQSPLYTDDTEDVFTMDL